MSEQSTFDILAFLQRLAAPTDEARRALDSLGVSSMPNKQSELLETLIETLSLHAFVKIHNTFTIWWATPETRLWVVEVTHVTRRDFNFNLSGNDLLDLLKQAMDKIEAFEREKAQERKR